MLSNHQKIEESSSDEENLAALKAVAVSFEDLTRKSGQDSSKNSGGGRKRCDPPMNNAEEGEESLPEGFQRTLWEALEQRLDSELRKKSSSAAVHAPSRKPAAATNNDEDSARIQLFKKTPRTAKFMAQQVNRKLVPHESLKTDGPINISCSRPAVKDEDEAELMVKVRSVAVDGEFVLKHAAKAALAAQKHTMSPESSDSGLDDRAPVGTVTRVLRAFKAVSTPAATSTKKKKKNTTTNDPVKHAGGQCDTVPASKDSQQQHDQEAQNLPAAGSKDAGGKRTSKIEDVPLSEEEKRARKRAKKLRQQQQHKDDAEHAAREKAKREKKKARAKAAKQAREHRECALAAR
ncbi:g11702 [Coccomyxa elongata]